MKLTGKFLFLIVLAVIGANGSTYASKAVFDKTNEAEAKRVFILGNFNEVSVSSGIDLYLQPSSKTEAAAFTSKEVMDKLEIIQHGEKVEIRFKSNLSFRILNNTNVKVYLSYKELKYISASGGSDVYMANGATLKAGQLEIDGSGGSDIRLKLNVQKLDCSLSGGSDGYLSGVADNADFNTSGGSDLHAKDLIVKNCNISTSGGSDAYIYVTEDLQANASGASDISFFGNPKKRNVSTSGASDVYSK